MYSFDYKFKKIVDKKINDYHDSSIKINEFHDSYRDDKKKQFSKNNFIIDKFDSKNIYLLFDYLFERKRKFLENNNDFFMELSKTNLDKLLESKKILKKLIEECNNFLEEKEHIHEKYSQDSIRDFDIINSFNSLYESIIKSTDSLEIIYKELFYNSKNAYDYLNKLKSMKDIFSISDSIIEKIEHVEDHIDSFQDKKDQKSIDSEIKDITSLKKNKSLNLDIDIFKNFNITLKDASTQLRIKFEKSLIIIKKYLFHELNEEIENYKKHFESETERILIDFKKFKITSNETHKSLEIFNNKKENLVHEVSKIDENFEKTVSVYTNLAKFLKTEKSQDIHKYIKIKKSILNNFYDSFYNYFINSIYKIIDSSFSELLSVPFKDKLMKKIYDFYEKNKIAMNSKKLKEMSALINNNIDLYNGFQNDLFKSEEFYNELISKNKKELKSHKPEKPEKIFSVLHQKLQNMDQKLKEEQKIYFDKLYEDILNNKYNSLNNKIYKLLESNYEKNLESAIDLYKKTKSYYENFYGFFDELVNIYNNESNRKIDNNKVTHINKEDIKKNLSSLTKIFEKIINDNNKLIDEVYKKEFYLFEKNFNELLSNFDTSTEITKLKEINNFYKSLLNNFWNFVTISNDDKRSIIELKEKISDLIKQYKNLFSVNFDFESNVIELHSFEKTNYNDLMREKIDKSIMNSFKNLEKDLAQNKKEFIKNKLNPFDFNEDSESDFLKSIENFHHLITEKNENYFNRLKLFTKSISELSNIYDLKYNFNFKIHFQEYKDILKEKILNCTKIYNSYYQEAEDILSKVDKELNNQKSDHIEKQEKKYEEIVENMNKFVDNVNKTSKFEVMSKDNKFVNYKNYLSKMSLEIFNKIKSKFKTKINDHYEDINKTNITFNSFKNHYINIKNEIFDFQDKLNFYSTYSNKVNMEDVNLEKLFYSLEQAFLKHIFMNFKNLNLKDIEEFINYAIDLSYLNIDEERVLKFLKDEPIEFNIKSIMNNEKLNFIVKTLIPNNKSFITENYNNVFNQQYIILHIKRLFNNKINFYTMSEIDSALNEFYIIPKINKEELLNKLNEEVYNKYFEDISKLVNSSNDEIYEFLTMIENDNEKMNTFFYLLMDNIQKNKNSNYTKTLELFLKENYKFFKINNKNKFLLESFVENIELENKTLNKKLIKMSKVTVFEKIKNVFKGDK